MALDLTGIQNENEFYTSYYLREVLEKDLKDEFADWAEQSTAGDSEEEDSRPPHEAFGGRSGDYFQKSNQLLDAGDPRRRLQLQRELLTPILETLGYDVQPMLKKLRDDRWLPVLAQVTRPDGTPALCVVEAPPADGEETTDPLEQKLTAEQFEGLRPEALMPLVRSIRTEEQLDDLQQYLPEEAYEALFLLAAGYSQREVDNELAYSRQKKEVDTEDYEAALQRPNSKRRFAIVEDDEGLERMLEAPLEKWRVFLHPTQRRLVTMHANGPVRVLGGAGTGKTVVAMHRAVWLAENFFTEPDDQLLFTTFTRNLAADIKENLRLIGSPYVLDRIEVTNLDAWLSRFLQEQGYEYTIDYRGQGEDL